MFEQLYFISQCVMHVTTLNSHRVIGITRNHHTIGLVLGTLVFYILRDGNNFSIHFIDQNIVSTIVC